MAEQFPSNSKRDRETPTEQKSEEPRKKVEQIVEGEVVRRKKPMGKRVAETFIGTDAKSVWAFVAVDVLVPAAKDMIADAVSQGVERMIYGESTNRSRRGSRRPNDPYVSYNRYSSRRPGPRDPRDREEPRMSRRAKAQHDFDEIILPTRVEANEVIDRMFDLVSKYEVATVADLYDLVGISGSYTDDKWGWYELRGADVTRTRHGGYLLNLPRPEPLD